MTVIFGLRSSFKVLGDNYFVYLKNIKLCYIFVLNLIYINYEDFEFRLS